MLKRQLFKATRRLVSDESGPTAVEYAVMLSLIVVVCLASLQALANNLSGSLNTSAEAINNAIQ